MSTETISPKSRLLKEAARIFGDKGFSGASVREICKAADTSSNMIHHYFGSKQGLYDAVIERFSQDVFDVPIRVISNVPDSVEAFSTRLQIFFEESLEALVVNRRIYELANRERLIVPSFAEYNASLIAFMESGKSNGFVRPELDCEMVTGLFLDRLGPQIFYAEQIKQLQGENLLEPGEYRKRWMKANLDLFLHGIVKSG